MTRPTLKPIRGVRKANQATEVLADLARSMGGGAKLPTIRQLCKQMRVSLPTIDTALDRLENQGLLYRKHGSGIYVSSLSQTRRVGVVIRSLAGKQSAGMFYRLLLDALQGQCRERNDLLTYYLYDAEHDRTGHGPQHLKVDIANKRVDGLVLAGLTGEEVDQVQGMEIPAVTYCAWHTRGPRVALDNHATILEGVKALVGLGRGRIAFAYPNYAPAAGVTEFVKLFQRALSEEGAQTRENWLIPFRLDAILLRALEASRHFRQLWTDADRPDALLSMNDEYTAGVLNAAEMMGVRIPQDLLVASHANVGPDLFNGAEVIRIEYDPAATARACLLTLDELLQGKPVTAVRHIQPSIRTPAEVCP